MASRAMLDLVDARQDREPRFRTMLLAKLVTTSGEHPVRIRELGPTGALLEGETLPKVGSDAILLRGALEAFAHVAGTRGGQCELLFDEPMNQAEMLLCMHSPALEAVPAPRFRRPSLKAERLSEDEQKLVEAWGRPTGRLGWGD